MAKSEPTRLTPFEKFEEAAKRIFQVPKRDVDKAERRQRKEREAKRTEQPR